MPGARADGSFHAIGDLCTHEDVQLSDGEVEGTDIECPAHGSRFDLVTGEVRGLPATVAAHVYTVFVEGNDLVVDVSLGWEE